MIVNSNLQHSQVLKSELDNRVSFDVYQDTEEKNIWRLMEGGKDDIYVYDRCGRLAYYIPFPLSIMSSDDRGSDLVRAAIIAAYFRSRCGDTCDQNGGRSSLEEFLNSNLDATESTTEVVFATVLYPDYIPESNVSEVSWNETISPENDGLLKAAENSTDFYSAEDFDYPTSNETIGDGENNVTLTRLPIHNDLHNALHGNGTFDEIEDSNSTSSTNESLPNTNPRNITNENPAIIDVDHNHSESNDTEIQKPKPKIFIPKRKFDRCAEADLPICKNWSKRRLLRAQTCCSTDLESASRSQSCKNYGKKRCKKIRTVLKCCIKTAYVETTTTEVPDLTTLVDTTTVLVPTLEGTTEVVRDVFICCKDVSTGRVCRVSSTSICKRDEFLSEAPADRAPSESTN